MYIKPRLDDETRSWECARETAKSGRRGVILQEEEKQRGEREKKDE